MPPRNIEKVSVCETPEKETAESGRMRFVVADGSEQRELVMIQDFFPRNHFHIIPPDTTLVGGGKIRVYGKELEAEWDSRSCREELGYDRPADAAEAQQLLQEVRSVVADWLKRVLS